MNKNLLVVLGVIVALVLIAGGWLISGYNQVVTMDENVKTALGPGGKPVEKAL